MDDVRRCSGPNGGTELVLVKFARTMAGSS
jgi:hypothetical protein